MSKLDKEIEQKMLIKRTVNSMNKQIDKLEEQKTMFLEKAKQARKHGLDAQLDLALTGYRITLAQQKRAREMLLNFEITSQMKDMTMMTRDFLGGMGSLSKEMSKLANSRDFVQVQKEFEKAMAAVETQSEQMEVFMDMSRDSFASSSQAAASKVNNADVLKMVDESMSADAGDEDIDKEIADLKKKLEADGE